MPPPAGRILIVDDMDDARWVLSNLIQQAGFSAVMAASGDEALARIQEESPDLVLLDICLPDMDGFEVLTQARVLDKGVPVIMLTAFGKTHDAVRAIRAGAYDYVTKPFNHEDIVLTIGRALKERALRRQLRQFNNQSCSAGSLSDVMGKSAVVQRIQSEVAQVAPTNFSVLATGETGTGKELIAQAIHAQSPRAAKPLVVVDCGAIPDSLIESELFGHEKNAFTGAHSAKAGAFELADGGTIFLDEIGNLPLAMQAKLLRVLETRRIHRIGSADERDVDFRVVAATNVDLRSAADQQTFRRDLYHRLAEFTICLPSLRERKEDIPFLVNRFLGDVNKDLNKQVTGLSDAAWRIIQRYDWPGNVRELRSQLRRAVLLCDEAEQTIGPELLGMLDADNACACPTEPLDLDQPKACCPHLGSSGICPFQVASALQLSDNNLSLKRLVREAATKVERTILLRVLELAHGNKAQSARLLQIDYKTLQSKLKAHEIHTIRVTRTQSDLFEIGS